MLCTWLMEIYLKRLATLGGGEGGREDEVEREEEEEEYERMVEEFRCFLRGHVEDLKIHPPTTYSLLGSHGRKREMLLYATLIEDVERVVSFHMSEGEYGPALGVLEEADFERVEGLFYKYAHQLMENEPMKTLAVWMNKPGLNPVKLLPALAKHIALASTSSSSASSLPSSSSTEKLGGAGTGGRKGGKKGSSSSSSSSSSGQQQENDVRALAIRYLEYRSSLPPSPSLPPSSPTLYNYLLQLYAAATGDENEEKLLLFLRTHAPSGPSGVGEGGREGGRAAALDLRYALRVCAQQQKTRACVHLYSCLGLFEEAVALALRAGEVGLAKEQAGNAESHEEGGREEKEGVQKRLWVMIARHLIEVQKVSPKEAIRLLEESNSLLSIEGLLPYFPEFTTIDSFKDKICESLSSYSQTIQGLKQEMEELALSTAEMEKAIAALKGRHLSLSTSQKCVLCCHPVRREGGREGGREGRREGGRMCAVRDRRAGLVNSKNGEIYLSFKRTASFLEHKSEVCIVLSRDTYKGKEGRREGGREDHASKTTNSFSPFSLLPALSPSLPLSLPLGPDPAILPLPLPARFSCHLPRSLHPPLPQSSPTPRGTSTPRTTHR